MNYYTIKQASEMFSVSLSTIYNRRNAGKYPHATQPSKGGKWAIPDCCVAPGSTCIDGGSPSTEEDELSKATRAADLAEQKERKATANNKKGEAELAMVLRDAGMTVEELEEKVKALGGDLIEMEGLMDEINALHKKSETGMPQEFRPPLKKLMVLIYKRLGKDTGEKTEEGVE